MKGENLSEWPNSGKPLRSNSLFARFMFGFAVAQWLQLRLRVFRFCREVHVCSRSWSSRRHMNGRVLMPSGATCI